MMNEPKEEKNEEPEEMEIANMPRYDYETLLAEMEHR